VKRSTSSTSDSGIGEDVRNIELVGGQFDAHWTREDDAVKRSGDWSPFRRDPTPIEQPTRSMASSFKISINSR